MGLAYVAPIGVQNLFVIHSALAHPRRRPWPRRDRHFFRCDPGAGLAFLE